MKDTSKACAFTIFELLIVIALVALLATLAITNFSFLHRSLLKNEAEKLATVMRSLQQRAVTEHTKHTISFFADTNEYAYNGTREQLEPSIFFGTQPGVLGPPSSPTKIIEYAISVADHTITFYPDGTMTPASVYLTDRAGSGTYAVTISVGNISWIRIYHHHGTWCLVR